MPSDTEARRQAALEELDTAIAVLSRVAERIADAPVSARERRLLRTMTSELARARRAVRILGRK